MALTLALCCSGPAAAGAPGASPQVIPLEQFTRFEAFGTIRISPDGTTVAATGSKDGRSVLTFLDVRTSKILSNTISRRAVSATSSSTLPRSKAPHCRSWSVRSRATTTTS
jgi:hypothetical protein